MNGVFLLTIVPDIAGIGTNVVDKLFGKYEGCL
jgi:hypothetical protein